MMPLIGARMSIQGAPCETLFRGRDTECQVIQLFARRVYKNTKSNQVKILLETSACQGTNLGYRFEHLAEIIEQTSFSYNPGVYFDTCHVFARGYDFRIKESYGQILNEFDKIKGLK